MADICIVYASEDRGLAGKLHGLLEQQWETWWDNKIVGPYPRAIEAEIPKSKCIVMLLSKSSWNKETVLGELVIAQKNGIDILIARLDHSELSYPFNFHSVCEMNGWNGEIDDSGFKHLQRLLASVVPPRIPPKRPLAIADGRLGLPKLFFSVSSYNTSIKPGDAVQALQILEAPSILISAYDLVGCRKPKGMLSKLKKYRKHGGIVLVDSGNYEASRLDDESWSVDKFNEVLADTPHDFAFCFDEMNPSMGRKKAIKQIINGVERDQKYTTAPILPIVHAPQLKKGGYKLEDIPLIFFEVSKSLQPLLIAIPERELGGGIIARAKMVRAIREKLNQLPYYQPIHILGTGHPWAIAILTAAGADSFDGLEWCRYALDEDREAISHFHLFDLFGTLDQSKMGFAANVAFHNLRYLKWFQQNMHEMVAENKIELWVSGVINDKKTFSKLKDQYEEIFE